MKKAKTIRNTLLGLSLAYALSNPAPTYSQTKAQEEFSYLARKNIVDLTLEEKRTLVGRLSFVESTNNPNAVNIVLKKNKRGEVVEKIYSVGQNQINISESGALADYNSSHEQDFTPQDMFNPQNNEIVRDWYLFERLPRILESKGIETTVANCVGAYNCGARRLKQTGRDAIKYFQKLPEITQHYLKMILGEDLFR
ncbi:transglycosylase SLT domain-containing protein [Candidatus Pacearchaeota archaeon]|nr:transglycosylase SLT domain-containing protein [Candidatus Pacearchaeota archaeon]